LPEGHGGGHSANVDSRDKPLQEKLPTIPETDFVWSAEAAKDGARLGSLKGVLWRRVIAFALDFTLLLAVIVVLWIANLFVIGLLWGLIVLLWPALLIVLYDTATIGGHGATFGMRLLGLRVRSLDGTPPRYLQAFLMSVIFSLP
jgi:uncharacterized RDD family membrane protein YckC